MRLKEFLLFSAIIAVGIFNSCPSLAVTPTEPTSEKYLLDHGHSQEIIRMINLQKERTEGTVAVASKTQNKFKKFFKNLWFEQDLTMPVTDFGYNNIKSVETAKSLIPPAVDKVKTKIKEMDNNKKSKDSNEININEVKVREIE